HPHPELLEVVGVGDDAVPAPHLVGLGWSGHDMVLPSRNPSDSRRWRNEPGSALVDPWPRACNPKPGSWAQIATRRPSAVRRLRPATSAQPFSVANRQRGACTTSPCPAATSSGPSSAAKT